MPRPPRAALAKASPAEVANWVRTMVGRPLNRAETLSLLAQCGIDAERDPSLQPAVDGALERFRARWGAFLQAELVPQSDQRGSSLAALCAQPADSAAFIVGLRAQRHALEDAMLDDVAGALAPELRPRVEIAKAIRSSQVPPWATGAPMPAGTAVPLVALAWDAAYVPADGRQALRATIMPALAAHASARSRLTDGLLKGAIESDLMADQVAVDVQRAMQAARARGSAPDAQAAVGLAMSRQLLPVMCAAGDVQSANAQLLEALQAAMPPHDFDLLMQAFAKAASVPLQPSLDPDAALSNARRDSTLLAPQQEALAAIADAWRHDDAALLVSWVASMAGLSRSMCDALRAVRWDSPDQAQGQAPAAAVSLGVQQRQMQLVDQRGARASMAIEAMKAQLPADAWERIRPTRSMSADTRKGQPQ